jgi:hypothetical protein
MEEFLTLYEPALERVEIEMVLEVKQPGGPSLSARMRDS